MKNTSRVMQRRRPSKAIAHAMETLQGDGAAFQMMPPGTMDSKVAQLKTEIAYGGLQEFTFSPGKNKKDVKGDVATEMRAKLDYSDPQKGSDTGGSDAFSDLMTALDRHTSSTWVRGHLLNHDLGGQAIYNNLFPITSAANSSHKDEVEKQVIHWIANKSDAEYHVKAEQVNEDGAGKFICWAQADKNGSFKGEEIQKTIWSVPTKISSAFKYSRKKSRASSRFALVDHGRDNTNFRDTYSGKYKRHKKWIHSSGNKSTNNRKVKDSLALIKKRPYIMRNQYSSLDPELAHYVKQIQYTLMMDRGKVYSLEKLSDLVSEHYEGDDKKFIKNHI